MNTEPVEINFQINNDELADQSKKAVRSILGVGDASQESTVSIEDLNNTIKRLKSQQAELNKIINDASKWGKAPKALTDEYDKISKEIQEAESRIAGYGKKIDEAGTAHVSLRTQIQKVRDEMAALRNAAEQNGQTINETSGRYAELKTELGRLYDIQKDITRQGNVLANDEASFQGIIQGISGVAGGFSAAAGAVGMFAGENENLQLIMTKVQSLMAVTIGLQQVAQTLNKDSAFRLKTLVQIQNLYSSAIAGTSKALVSLGISANVARVAAQALYATLTLGLAIAIPVVINAVSKFIDKQNEAKKAVEAFNNKVVENSVESITNFERLRKSYEKVGDTIEAKTDFIIKNQDEFKKLGVQINTVNDADNIFINNAAAFKESIMLRAQAIAAMELAAEKYKASLEKMLKAENREQNPSFWDTAKGSFGFPLRNLGDVKDILNLTFKHY